MKKILLAALAVCPCFYTSLHAQWSAGVSAGYTNNELYTNISNYNYNSYHKEGGFVVAVPVHYVIRNWLAVKAEPGFIEKSFSLRQTVPGNPQTQLTSRYHYLQLPLMAQFSYSVGRWRGFANLGGYGAYWLYGRIKGTELDGFNYTFPDAINLTQDVDGKYEFDNRRDRHLQFGWLAGGGVQYTVSKKLDVFAEGRYYQDLTDQQKSYMHNQVPRYNNTASVSAGCLYHFSTRKRN
jgi:opacity protein-like surface antigen